MFVRVIDVAIDTIKDTTESLFNGIHFVLRRASSRLRVGDVVYLEVEVEEVPVSNDGARHESPKDAAVIRKDHVEVDMLLLSTVLKRTDFFSSNPFRMRLMIQSEQDVAAQIVAEELMSSAQEEQQRSYSRSHYGLEDEFLSRFATVLSFSSTN